MRSFVPPLHGSSRANLSFHYALRVLRVLRVHVNHHYRILAQSQTDHRKARLSRAGGSGSVQKEVNAPFGMAFQA